MKLMYILLAPFASAYECVLHNTSYTSLDIYSNNWIHDLMIHDEFVTLGFNPPTGMSMNDWIVKNGWGIEEWKRDNKQHFNAYYDKDLSQSVLRIDIHRNDGDGSNNQKDTRVRQELKIYDPSPDEWKIHFGDYIYFELLLKFDVNFEYNLTHFYHVFQLKPMEDLSQMPIFTISTIKEDVYVSFNTVKQFSDKRPGFKLYRVIERSKIIGKWLRFQIFFHPVKDGETEILFIVRDLCNKTLHHNYITGKIYQDDISPFIRPKIGQYHKYSEKLPYTNSIYYANVTMKKLKVSKHVGRNIFDTILNRQPQSCVASTKTLVLIRPTTRTRTIVKTVIKPTTTTVYDTSQYQYTNDNPFQTTSITSIQTDVESGNAIVNAINRVFGLNLGENVEQHSCAARHAASEPTIAYAHSVWRTGDTCQGGIGAVWSSSPDPYTAARMWLNSPPHANIIQSARRLACGSGPSSAVCIAYY